MVRAGKSFVVCVCGLLSAAWLTGCAGYTNINPSPEGAGLANQDPNRVNPENLMIAALSFVMAEDHRIPGSDPIAINVPSGTRKSTYERIARTIGHNVRPLTSDALATGVPTYHVGRIWIRNDQARVDIYRPVQDARTRGQLQYQEVTVLLKGGFQPWHRVGSTSRPIGLAVVPEPWYVPETDDPNEFRKWAMANAERQYLARQNNQPLPEAQVVVEEPPALPEAVPLVPLEPMSDGTPNPEP